MMKKDDDEHHQSHQDFTNRVNVVLNEFIKPKYRSDLLNLEHDWNELYKTAVIFQDMLDSLVETTGFNGRGIGPELLHEQDSGSHQTQFTTVKMTWSGGPNEHAISILLCTNRASAVFIVSLCAIINLAVFSRS
ncbi:hypothetical protein ACOME3_009880 [Neoechinorhynchus agilis]